jgi:hypothetical protein
VRFSRSTRVTVVVFLAPALGVSVCVTRQLTRAVEASIESTRMSSIATFNSRMSLKALARVSAGKDGWTLLTAFASRLSNAAEYRCSVSRTAGSIATAGFCEAPAAYIMGKIVRQRVVRRCGPVSQLATQFSTFPLGSSSGGITYVFDESVGTFRRSSSSFGPLFAERALTIGRRKFSAGFNYQHTSYQTFEGQDLDDGSIKFYLRHNDCCTGSPTPIPTELFLSPNGTRLSPPFEGDIIEASLTLDAATDTTAAFANYGLTARWDVGIAVPVVSVNLDAAVSARVIRLVTDTVREVPDNPLTPAQRQGALNTHTFEVNNPSATRMVQHSGHASGLGDIVLRTKYRFLGLPGGGLAAAVDVRLPTGDENELLGAGGVEAKFLFIASSEHGRFGQHLNIGYTAAEGEVSGTVANLASASLPDEINYAGGVEFVPHPRVSIMGDFVGRTLKNAGRLEMTSQNFEYNAFTLSSYLGGAPLGCGGFPGNVCRTASFDALAPRAGDLSLLLGTAGVKVNPFGNMLISASLCSR